MELEAAQNLTN